jgi:hypothetical protein
LLDEQAPRTCEAVWRALPLEGDVFHAKYASNEIFTLLPLFAENEPGPENRTIVPIPGDVMYFYLPPQIRLPKETGSLGAEGRGVVDLAVFYDRNNILLSPSEGFTPGNVFATIVKGLDGIALAGNSIWREGGVGERLIFRRLQAKQLRKLGIDEN